MFKQGLYPIVKKTASAKGIFDITVLCPEIAELAEPGQFAQLLAEGFFLRRPISICGIDKAAGTIRMVFEVRGSGTEKLAELNVGENIDIIAPLGHGFTKIDGKAVCVGGGIGTPPILGIASLYGRDATVVSGFRNAAAVILQEDFKAAGCETVLCTDDGSAGIHGFVTTALEQHLLSNKTDIIYACGPTPMLKAIAAMAKKFGVRCEVSLEQRMACGVGACLGCACRTLQSDTKAPVEVYKHVCKDGPVFDAREVIFDG
ncbi:MAG: dihydroorotate dehydrogenase electron transfer subunit [Ruminococcus sp.]|nr:dihydroorotate dehydrogenase electron transfer subunit [Ruminococcus sp.]